MTTTFTRTYRTLQEARTYHSQEEILSWLDEAKQKYYRLARIAIAACEESAIDHGYGNNTTYFSIENDEYVIRKKLTFEKHFTPSITEVRGSSLDELAYEMWASTIQWDGSRKPNRFGAFIPGPHQAHIALELWNEERKGATLNDDFFYLWSGIPA